MTVDSGSAYNNYYYYSKLHRTLDIPTDLDIFY